jgi:hypothetical protein
MTGTAVATKTYISGDWEWQNELECYETAYAVESLGDRWNGWETPTVSRDVMDKIVHRQAFIRDSDAPFLTWDGNGVLVIEGDSESWLLPDPEGNFDLSPLGWCWVSIEAETNVIRRVG